MAYASIRTLIPLDNFAKILQIDPLHFNSVVTQLRPEQNACDDIYAQYDWQMTGRVSREAVAQALKQAEDTAISYLGYYPVPDWIQEEEHDLPRPSRPELTYVYNTDVRGNKQSINTDYGYFIEGGRRAKTLLSEGEAVVYSDPDGDGYDDLATVTVATIYTEPSEICVYYPGKVGADIWEIRPTTVSIGAGIATITFKKYQVPLEVELEALAEGAGDSYRAIDGDDNTNFLQTVDVYRVYNDPSQQLEFLSEVSCTCHSAGCLMCSETSESGCMYPRDSKLGTVAISRATWDSTAETFGPPSSICTRPPSKVKIWYRAGFQNRNLERPLIHMDPTWERMIVYYALTLIDTEICGCDNTQRIVTYMRQDLARPTTQGAFAISSSDLNCPLGTSRAALHLWKRIVSPGTRLVTHR